VPKENSPPTALGLGAGFGAGDAIDTFCATWSLGAGTAGEGETPKKLKNACFGFSVFAAAGVGAGAGRDAEGGTTGALAAAGREGFDPKNEVSASVIALGAISISATFFTSAFG